jgi:hypothetical protein
MSKASQRQIVAEVEGWNGNARPYFAMVAGANITAANEKVFDGGSLFPDILCAPSEIDNLTVTRDYDPESDGELLKKFRHQVGSARFRVAVFTLNCDLKVPSSERVYDNTLLVSIAEPEGDSGSGKAAKFSLVFAIGAVSS